MQYSRAIQYLFSFLDFERLPFQYQRELNLRRMRRLLDWFGRPDQYFQAVLIAGTKGKGSTASFLASILSAHGEAVGLYTSPHLTDPRERIRLNGKMISKRDFAAILGRIRPVIERRKREITADGVITFFEIFTLLAILYFAAKKVRFGIFEVGMGGRLDATNVLHPVLSVITPISFDHEEHLGRTLSAIAREKAAIIKENALVVIGNQPPEAKRVFEREIKRQRAKAFFFGTDFRPLSPSLSLAGSRFDFEMGRRRLRRFAIRLPGQFQIENVAVALSAACALESTVIARNPNRFASQSETVGATKQSLNSRLLRSLVRHETWRASSLAMTDTLLSEMEIRKGLLSAFWPGRFEVVRRYGRTIVLDGAHNDASMRALSKALKRLFPRKQFIFVLGISREKNLVRTLKPILSTASAIVATQSNNLRAQEPRILIETLKEMGYGRPTFWAPDLYEAVQLAKYVAKSFGYAECIPSPLVGEGKPARPAGGDGGVRMTPPPSCLPRQGGGDKVVVVITGSLFLVGEARSYFKCRTFG